MSNGTDPTDGWGAPEGGAGRLVVPLFPLPNVVLFPRAVLPLHIFEERYKVMTADALDGDRRVAMALLKGGWEKDYYSRPVIEPVVCVGRILSHERLADGRYNFLLQGVARARVVREMSAADDGPAGDRPYRVAVVQPLSERAPDPDALAAGRAALASALADGALGQTPLGRKFAELIKSGLPTGDLADLVAFNFIDDVPTKQAMLAEPDPARRLAMLTESLGCAAAAGPSPTVRMFRRPSLN